MENNKDYKEQKTLILGLVLDTVNEKNFTELKGKINKEENTQTLIVSTPYKGQHNYLIIILPVILSEETQNKFHFESQVDRQIFKRENINSEELMTYLNLLPIQK